MTNAALVHACLLSAGAALGTGLLSGAAHIGNREDDFYLPYAVTCFAGTIVFIALAMLYDAVTFDRSMAALRLHVVGVSLVLPGIVWLFSRIARRPAARGEMMVLLLGSVVLVAANAIAPASLHFASARPVASPIVGRWGILLYFDGRGGWITVALHLWMLVPIWFCFLNGRHLWRHGDRAVGGLALAASAALMLANVIGTRSDFVGARSAYVGAVPVLFFTIMLLGMALGFSQRRQRLALESRGDDLRRTVDQLQHEVLERALLERRLAETQRMEALGRMAAGVAHDFNNVLTVAGGHAELIRQQPAPGGDPAPHAGAILGAVQRGALLTRQLLAFARRQELAPSDVDADQLIDGMRELLASLAGPGTSVVLELGSGGHTVLADPAQFVQVLTNLVVNAGDAMGEGGRLAITTAWVAAAAAPACACGGAVERGHVLLTVADSGHGIDPGTLPRIFEPFFTTKGPELGTGLGLATVHGIVRQSGGHISVESRPGEGATFRICWPSGRPVADAPADNLQRAAVRTS